MAQRRTNVKRGERGGARLELVVACTERPSEGVIDSPDQLDHVGVAVRVVQCGVQFVTQGFHPLDAGESLIRGRWDGRHEIIGSGMISAVCRR